MRVIVPMSGHGKRFQEAGYKDPKPLIEVDGKSIVAHLLGNFPAEWPKTFICNEDHLATTRMREVLQELAPGSEIVGIPSHKKGPVWAVLEAARLAPASVPDGEPCIVNYCDFSWSWDPLRFEAFARRTACDGAVICYTGFHPEYIRPALYAYCREENGRLLEIKEKGHFTPDRTREFASSGTYYFRSGAVAKKYFRAVMEDQGLHLNGEGYVSVVYSPMLRDGLHVRVFEIPYFLQWGTPADLKDYEYWSGIYARYPFRNAGASATPANPPMQLLMPMAGRGSRFNEAVPKPLVKVMGLPLFKAALEHLPAASRNVLVVRDEFKDRVQETAPAAALVSIQGVTEGQAITCELAAGALDPDLPLFVSSCDHGMVWDEAEWNAMATSGQDLIVWGQRGYTAAEITPKAFGWIECEPGSARIRRVSVKEPISATPREDLLLVGTFWFRRPELMLSLIRELKEKNIRVNNEFYLDSVVNLAVQRGLKVSVFEAQGYLCWGTPASLQEFNYWHAYFNGLERGSTGA